MHSTSWFPTITFVVQQMYHRATDGLLRSINEQGRQQQWQWASLDSPEHFQCRRLGTRVARAFVSHDTPMQYVVIDAFDSAEQELPISNLRSHNEVSTTHQEKDK